MFRLRSEIGLVGEGSTSKPASGLNTDSHLSACIDSYYEYMVKCARLFGDQDCQQMWDSSIVAVNRYLADSTSTGLWYGHADMNTGERTRTWFGALDAFFPAVLVLAGDLRRAALLQESCFTMWNKYGIEPEDFDYAKMEAARPRFFLNPEIMESAYYLYRATGDERYLVMGKTFLEDLKKYCRVPGGYAELKNVITKEKVGPDGELLPCRNPEIPLSALRPAGDAGLQRGHLQHRSPSDPEDLVNARERAPAPEAEARQLLAMFPAPSSSPPASSSCATSST